MYCFDRDQKETGRKTKTAYWHILLLPFLIMLVLSGPAQGIAGPARDKKVLIVMSYHQDYQGGEGKYKARFDSLLKEAQLKYFYLDTKNNLSDGKDRAREAYALYQEFHPDAVIAANDNAQSLFVVPYLKDKVQTPVIFCGVNDDAAKYGYPASNVTGVLEKAHFHESIDFARLVDPRIKKIVMFYSDTPSNRAYIDLIQREMSSYYVAVMDLSKVRTLTELKHISSRVESMADAILSMNLSGIVDSKEQPLEGVEAIQTILRSFKKPCISTSKWQIEAGALCGVVKVAGEQADLAGGMLLDLFSGKSIGDMEITQNKSGRRMINMTTAKHLGLEIDPAVLADTDIVYSDN